MSDWTDPAVSLPPQVRWVLCVTDTGDFRILWYLRANPHLRMRPDGRPLERDGWFNSGDVRYTVDRWRPLPAPPTGFTERNPVNAIDAAHLCVAMEDE